jgi:galactose mutarotase-like enzyme
LPPWFYSLPRFPIIYSYNHLNHCALSAISTRLTAYLGGNLAIISRILWNDFPAFTLESHITSVVIVPDLGAKIVSLYDKVHQREWLAPPMRPLKQTVYGADFVSQDMSGWDEMLPTIDACDWQGSHLPDHGEVWSVPWQLESAEEALIFSVTGRAMPYRFTRSAKLVDPGCLELRYTLTNIGKSAFPYLWAAHPQFLADAHTRILFPPEVRQVVNVIANDPLWGEAGAAWSWPQAVCADGQLWRLDRVRSVENHACRKFYLPPDEPVAWAALLDERLGCQIQLEWSPRDTPYLGLWVDEGMYNAVPVAALEPSNAYYDSLERAVKNDRVSVLQADQTASWTLRIGMS